LALERGAPDVEGGRCATIYSQNQICHARRTIGRFI
jgi:hypothetical protein